jgi:hypothetical protein
MTLMASFLTGTWGRRRLGAIVLVVFAVVGCGSDSSGPGAEGSARKGAAKEEDLYKYVGEGAAKKKVDLTRRERQQVRREKSQSSD